MLIYFLKGTLPWYNLLHETNEEKNENIKEMMKKTTLQELCRDCPYSIKHFMEYCRNKIKFTDEPDYNYLTYLLE